MKQIFLFAICSLFYFNSYATAQAGDIIIYKGDTSILYSLPLQYHPDINRIRKDMFDGKEVCVHTGCWRGYQAEWTVIADEIYLTSIISCCYYKDRIKADLAKLFPGKYKEGKMKADWFNGNLSIQKGRLLHYVHQGFGSIYEREIELVVENGKIKDIWEYDNSYTRESIFTKRQDSLSNFLYRRIAWNEIPNLEDQKIRINLIITSTGTEKPTVTLSNDKGDIYSSEALRVGKLIPEWDVYYRKGKPIMAAFPFQVVFSEENRKKYIKQQ